MSAHQKTSVIIVGGSLVGLSTALLLSTYKVPLILLERHPSSSLHPRAIGYTARTLEILRSIGCEDRFPKSKWTGGPPRRVAVESLTGKWREEQHWTPKHADDAKEKPNVAERQIEDYSPETGIATAQDKVEPVLREYAIERGADLRLGCKVTNFTQDEHSVTATYINQDGKECTVEGQYLVACDGGKSEFREKLGIQRHGVGEIRTLRSILFRCPKIDSYLDKGVSQFQIEGREDGFEAFMTTYGEKRWALMWNPPKEQTGENATMDEVTQKDLIRKGVGQDLADEDIELITTGEWNLSGLIAEKFSSGRIFLAGDAAHALPPNRGGYGANTGIADAQNIAWKLASVLNGTSKPELLETYDAERRPVAQVRHDQIFARDDHRQFVQEREWQGKDVEILDDVSMELGQIYNSGGVIEGVDSPLARRPDEWNGQPGTRAPHFWLKRGGEKISSLDLFGYDWVVLSKDASWKDLVGDANGALGVKTEFVQVGKDVEEMEDVSFEKSFGVDGTGAVLVRPDGYIAWRVSSKPDDAGALRDALKKVAYA